MEQSPVVDVVALGTSSGQVLVVNILYDQVLM